MNIKHKQIQTINEFIDAIRIRVDVFIIEQGCPPGWEPAEEDKVSQHYIALVDKEIVATVRLREYPQGVAKIETMVVKKEHRGKGIGVSLTRYVMKQAQ